MRSRIRRVGVVVPAHNEQHHLADCLMALQTAARRVPIPVAILVVLDDCTDGSRDVCRHFGVSTREINARTVGTARAIGFQTLIGTEPNPDAVWLATTDADSQVEATWLGHQVGLADDGADVVLGVVRLHGHTAAPEVRRAFHLDYHKQLFDDGSHTHIHGANLGLRASTYLQVGGFPHLPNHEDRHLIQRLRRTPDVIIETTQRLIVSTSGRLESRCDDGFAAALTAIEAASQS